MMKYYTSYLNELEAAADSLDLTALSGKSILITGGSGLICSAVVDILICANMKRDLGVTLYLAARSEERTSERFGDFWGVEWLRYVKYDALKPVEFAFKSDYIIHGASNAHPSAYSTEPVETLLANVTGLKELLDYAVKSETSRVLYISSSEVYGRKDDVRPFREDDYGFVDILNPRACYPSGKRAAETLCAAYQAEYGVDSVIVRPGHIYGPTITEYDSRATAQFTRKALADEDIVMKSAGTQLRSYCYSTDCATALLTVLLKGKSGEAYNISNRDSVVSIRQIAEEFAVAAGRSVVFEVPSDKEQKSYNLMDNSSLDSEKLESLGWRGRYTAHDGVIQTMIDMRGE